jgi:hypothetical protein
LITEPSEPLKADVSSQPPRASTSRFGLRFSLLSLLTFAAMACVAAAFYGTRQREAAAVRRMESLRAQVKMQQIQIERLRAELGYLTIYAKDKVHLLQLPTRDQHHWKWRVYLPSQRRWLAAAMETTFRRWAGASDWLSRRTVIWSIHD